MDFFDEEIEEEKTEEDLIFNIFEPRSFIQVDMSKINKDHPLYEMLERSNGIYNSFL